MVETIPEDKKPDEEYIPEYARNGLENKPATLDDILRSIHEVRDILLLTHEVKDLKNEDMPKVLNALQRLVQIVKIFV